MIWLTAMILGCSRSDPWAGAPAPPPTVQAHAYYEIGVRGQIAGFEERWSGSEDGQPTVVRRRTWSLVLGGQPVTVRAASETRGAGPVTSYTRWTPGGTTAWAGAAWIPDAVPPPEGGLWPVLEPWTLEVRATSVAIEQGVISWETSAGRTRAQFDEHGLIWAEQGVVRMALRRSPPAIREPLDPVALFAIPVAPQPAARRALVGRFEVDGRAVRVDAPIWAEVPSVSLPVRRATGNPLQDQAEAAIEGAVDQRDAVRRLVAHVADRLDGLPTPGSLGAVEALESGRGDCDEASAAFVALARAVGLDAEPVGGLVYANGVLGPGMYPHAWALVRIGGREVAVDPALGQAPADASHLVLGPGAGAAAARLSAGIRVGVVELR